jgi:hypothetical protein
MGINQLKFSPKHKLSIPFRLSLTQKKYIYFNLIGFWNTCLSIALLKLTFKTFDFENEIYGVFSVSFFVIFQAFIISRYLLWKSRTSFFLQLLKYYGSYLPVLVANLLVLIVFTRFLKFDVFISQVVFSFVSSIFLFALQKNHVFQRD